jgi:carboxyl-terminal processing protease
MDRYNHPDSIHYDILPKYTTLRNGRIVYGGGGIIPDVYITPGSGHQHTFVSELRAKGLTHELIATYFDSHDISTFRRDYPTLQSFIDGFDLDDEFRDYIINIVCGGDKNLAEDKDGITVAIDMIKAQIADDIYGHGAYYRLFGHTVDDTLSKAIEIVKDREMMESLLGAKE